MRLAPTLAIVVALALAGCGGEQIEADEVPGAPAALTLPPEKALATPTADADADASASATPTPTATADASGTTTTTPPATTTTPPTTTAPATGTGGTNTTGGADGNFEDFCAQNPGAC